MAIFCGKFFWPGFGESQNFYIITPLNAPEFLELKDFDSEDISDIQSPECHGGMQFCRFGKNQAFLKNFETVGVGKKLWPTAQDVIPSLKSTLQFVKRGLESFLDSILTKKADRQVFGEELTILTNLPK
jgi:hypothetical protein